MDKTCSMVQADSQPHHHCQKDNQRSSSYERMAAALLPACAPRPCSVRSRCVGVVVPARRSARHDVVAVRAMHGRVIRRGNANRRYGAVRMGQTSSQRRQRHGTRYAAAPRRPARQRAQQCRVVYLAYGERGRVGVCWRDVRRRRGQTSQAAGMESQRPQNM